MLALGVGWFLCLVAVAVVPPRHQLALGIGLWLLLLAGGLLALLTGE